MKVSNTKPDVIAQRQSVHQQFVQERKAAELKESTAVASAGKTTPKTSDYNLSLGASSERVGTANQTYTRKQASGTRNVVEEATRKAQEQIKEITNPSTSKTSNARAAFEQAIQNSPNRDELKALSKKSDEIIQKAADTQSKNTNPLT